MAAGFFNRVRRIFGFWQKTGNAPEITNLRSDSLCKLNLPPLMGRRDAAFDSVAALATSEILKFSDAERLAIYQQAIELLEAAKQDCGRIASAMTSPDSLRRERSLADYLEAMRCHLAVMVDAVQLGNQMMNGIVISGGLIEAPSASDIADSEMICRDTEAGFTGRLRSMIERVQVRITRYREYARRSFSPENAERYNTAYNYYMKVYQLPGVRD